MQSWWKPWNLATIIFQGLNYKDLNMPVEIRELLIKATLGEPDREKRPGSGANHLDKQEIIADCVEEVMRILKEEKER
jgi:hypothetical protein